MKKVLYLVMIMMLAYGVATAQSGGIEKYKAQTTPADYLPSNIRSGNSAFAEAADINSTAAPAPADAPQAADSPQPTNLDQTNALIDTRTHHRQQHEMRRAYRNAFWTQVALNTLFWGVPAVWWYW